MKTKPRSKRKTQPKTAANSPRKSTPGTFGPEKRREFLELYSSGMTVTEACKKVGTTSTTISLTTRKDPEFKKQYEAAQDINTDRIEEIVNGMAIKDRNMVACFFLLKARRPHIYRDNVNVTHNASTEIVSAFTAAMGRLTGSAAA